MKQAEKLLDDLGWSKAVLEIQYEHEVHVNVDCNSFSELHMLHFVDCEIKKR